ncbi:MAG: hypothetical protein PHH84_05625 [Oscillospiraceae bacterium]|nr:hypothetical protein [Oscillospiraceae bacterium]MDD4414250.1 hypothetical protein [Oscillospiraceae bacterium]
MVLVRIAEIPIQISCHDTDFFTKRLEAYRLKDEDIRPRMTLKSSVCDEIIPPEGELIGKIKAINLKKTADGRFFYYGDNRDNKVRSLTLYDPEYQIVEIKQLASRKHSVFSLTDFEYMYTGLAFSNRLAIEGGLVLHASALMYKGQGIAFSAISGTGKSTHTGLWSKYLDDVQIINDDKPAVRFTDDKPFLYGTPWSGKTDLNNNICAPFSALVFIEQSQENSIKRMGPAEAYFDMASEVSRPSCDEALGIRMLDIMERLLECVPIYKLSCNISREAVKTVYEEIIGGKMP